ncbi:MAG: glycosyl hydrolase [Propionibacteriaceae bacterium]
MPVLVAGLAVVTLVAAFLPYGGQHTASQAAVRAPSWGVYAGPGAKGVRGAEEFATTTHAPISRVLDFLPDETWSAMTHADWLIDAHARSARHLELSVPMLPTRGAATLPRCANGEYNHRWRTIATKLRDAGLQDTTIRPGWEFNGDWYQWSAAGPGQAAEYVGCFRQLVTTMRSVSPQFTFSWSVNNGHNRLPAELGWPGGSYVDIVGVDVYDYSSQWYPTPRGMTLAQARGRTWDTALNSPRGLRFWSDFARTHGKPLALSEWGLAWRANGQAGGDNTLFLDQLVGFVRNPANGVAYATYFNSVDTPALKHNLLHPQTKFPKGVQRLRQLMAPR